MSRAKAPVEAVIVRNFINKAEDIDGFIAANKNTSALDFNQLNPIFLSPILKRVEEFEQLHHLSLFYCHEIRDNDIEFLANSKLKDQLTSINLSGCFNLTLKALEHLTQFNKLETLELVRCKGINISSLNEEMAPIITMLDKLNPTMPNGRKFKPSAMPTPSSAIASFDNDKDLAQSL